MQAWPCLIRLDASVTRTVSTWVNEPGPSGTSPHLGVAGINGSLDEPLRRSQSGQEGLPKPLRHCDLSDGLSSSSLELRRFFSSGAVGPDRQLLVFVLFVGLTSARLSPHWPPPPHLIITLPTFPDLHFHTTWTLQHTCWHRFYCESVKHRRRVQKLRSFCGDSPSVSTVTAV